MRLEFSIKGMSCISCAMSIETTLKKLWLDEVNVNLVMNMLTVEDKSDKYQMAELVKEICYRVQRIGFEAVPIVEKVVNFVEPKGIKLPLVIALGSILFLWSMVPM